MPSADPAQEDAPRPGDIPDAGAPRPDRLPQPDRLPRRDRLPRPDRVARPDQSSRPDRLPQPDRVPRSDRVPQPDQSPRLDRVPQPDRVRQLDADSLDGVHLPRSQAGSPPQHLLVTFLADYCLRRSARLPSAALVALAGDFGVTATSARAGLSRLARRGVVEQTRRGRRTSYALSPAAARVLNRGSRRLVAFATDAEDWDGQWTVVAFSMPEDRRDARHLLRSRLRWQGFAPLYDGMWVSPRAGAVEVAEAVESLGLPAVTVLRTGEVVPAGPGTRLPLQAWDLDEIAEGYRGFLDRWTPVVQRLRRGDVAAGEALVVRTRIMDTYRRFPGLDPQLPMRLMPDGWPRERARELFAEAYDWLGPLAEARVRQIVAEHDPGMVPQVSHQTTADLLHGVVLR